MTGELGEWDVEPTFGDDWTRHRRLRAVALTVVTPLHRFVAEIEWQMCRLEAWIRDDQ